MHRHAGTAAISLATAAALMFVLVGCAPAPAAPVPESSSTPTPTPSPTAEPEPTAGPRTFQLPADCASALPESRLQQFADDGLILLGGPGGKHGDEYLADPTPEQSAGGITCIWGHDDSDLSVTTVSVAPLGANRPAVVGNLIAQGLNETIEGDVTIYAVQGDEDHAPGILNILRTDSWISVIQTTGGREAFAEALEVADEVAEQTYVG